MYIAAVAGFMVILPIVSVVIEVAVTRDYGALIGMIGKWFVFWAVGVRLLTAGARQIIKPGLTAEGILGIKARESWILVRELGFANVATGLAGVLSLWLPTWRPAVALVGGLFLLLAGLEHIPKNRNFEEDVALYSDLGIGLIMAVYLFSLL